MEKVREDFDHIIRALDELLYYDPVDLERQADEYEREMARKEGLEQGREEGREEGLKEKEREFVLKLRNKNYSIKEISDITELSEIEVNILLVKDK